MAEKIKVNRRTWPISKRTPQSEDQLKTKTGELLNKLLKSVDQKDVDKQNLERRMALGEIGGSFATLKDEAMINGYNDLAKILDASSHLSNII